MRWRVRVGASDDADGCRTKMNVEQFLPVETTTDWLVWTISSLLTLPRVHTLLRFFFLPGACLPRLRTARPRLSYHLPSPDTLFADAGKSDLDQIGSPAALKGSVGVWKCRLLHFTAPRRSFLGIQDFSSQNASKSLATTGSGHFALLHTPSIPRVTYCHPDRLDRCRSAVAECPPVRVSTASSRLDCFAYY